MLNDAEINNICRLEIGSAQGYSADFLQTLRGDSLDFYFGNTESSSIPEATAGRSNIVSMDVHDTVNSQLAEIIPLLRQTIVNFTPSHAADEPQAQLESDYVRDQIEKAGFDDMAYDGCFDAQLQGLGWWKVNVKYETEVTTRPLGQIVDDPIAREALVEAAGPDVDVTLTDTDTETVVRSEREIKRLNIESVAPENMLFSPDHSQFDIDTIRFVGERKVMTTDDLRAAGLTAEQAAEVPRFSMQDWTGSIARRWKYYGAQDEGGGQQIQTELKETFCCYIDIAMTENKPAEKYYVHIAGNHVVEKYPVSFHPYVIGSPLPVSHRIMGRGMYEVMRDVQAQKTHLLRQLNDSAMVANGSRTAYNENKVNVEHLTNGRINGVIAVDGIPGENILGMPSTDITGHMVTVLNYLDSLRASRGGSATDLTDADRQAMQGSAEAASGIKQAREKMAAFYARNLCNTWLKKLYIKTHKTLREYMTQPTMANLRGEWVQTTPSTWPARNSVKVLNGLTEFDRRQNIANLLMLIRSQTELIQQGGAGIITDVSKKYNAMSDWIRAANLGAPEEYLIDPNSDPALQTQRDKMAEATEQQNQAKQLMDLQRQLQEMALEVDKYKHDSDLKFKYWKEALEADTDIKTTVMDNQAKTASAAGQVTQ